MDTKSEVKYAVFAALGVVFIVTGSVLFAAASDEGGGNTFGRVFGGSLGVALILLGIGLGIAAAATFLARRE